MQIHSTEVNSIDSVERKLHYAVILNFYLNHLFPQSVVSIFIF